MDEFTTWVVVVATVVSVAFVLKLKSTTSISKPRNLPPGPKPLPVIGNLHLIGSLPHRSLHALSQKYGNIMQLKYGSVPVIVASSPELTKELLSVHDHNLAFRPKTAVGKYMSYDYSDILWSPYGSYWKYARRLFATQLLSAKRVEMSESVRFEEILALANKLCRSSGSKVSIKDEFISLNLNAMSRMALGKNYFNSSTILGPKGMSTSDMKNIVEEFIFLNGAITIGDFVPWLEFLDLNGYIKRMKATSKRFDEFAEYVVCEHEERPSEGSEGLKDLVDVLLQHANDPNEEVKLTRNAIKGLIKDLIVGGIETTSTAIEWAMSELLRHPDIASKATQELDEVVGRTRWIEEQDLKDLPFLEAILKESMRLHPVATLLAPRLTNQHIRVSGYDVPAGTMVLINAWAMARDPMIWENAPQFQPERFLGRRVGRDEFARLPFGAGRRVCPGQVLGHRVTLVTLARLLQGFVWRLPEGMTPADVGMEEKFAVVTSKLVQLEVVFEPRLPTHLYTKADG